MGRRKQTLLSREQISMNREADYIIKRAQRYESRVVLINGLIFFSTQTGDAWILDPEDHLALCLAQYGETQSFSILETPTKFQVAWEAQYYIDGDTFILVTKDGNTRTILGYPVREIEELIRRVG
ncbi:MAG: hypothetical protein AB1502_02035 [Thermodesulfobacteriota bacterium]